MNVETFLPEKFGIFLEYTENFGSVRQDTLLILIFAERKVVIFVDLYLYSNDVHQNTEHIHIFQKRSATFNNFWEASSLLP